jgi:hypothetical protein
VANSFNISIIRSSSSSSGNGSGTSSNPGLTAELRVNRHKPRGEIVQVVSASERFASQHEQRFHQLFGGLLHMICAGPGRRRRAAAIATSMSSSTIASHRLASSRFSGRIRRSCPLIHLDPVNLRFIRQGAGNFGPSAVDGVPDRDHVRAG